MVAYLGRRLATAAGLVLLVLTLIFLVIRAVPGDPASVLASGGSTGTATPEAVAAVRAQLGLDRPVLAQYVEFVAGALSGDLGTSFRDGTAVTVKIFDRLPNTLELVASAAVVGVLLGLVLGAAAGRRGGALDAVVTGLSSLAVSVPVYVLGVVLVFVVSLHLGWLPAGGSAGWDDPAAHLQRLVLPVTCLAVPLAAVVARMTRASVTETITQDWVRTGTSWGLRPGQVFRHHVLRNALTPVLTSAGLEVGIMLGSTVLVEQVFSYPGTSALLVQAVSQRDYPVVQGVVVVIAVMFILLNVLVDLLYGVLDPRVRR